MPISTTHDPHPATSIAASSTLIGAGCIALNLDPLERGLQIIDAATLARKYFPQLEPDQPALIGRVASQAIARECKRTLRLLYPIDHTVTRVDAVGTAAQTIAAMPLAVLDDANDFEPSTMVYVPPLARPSSMNALGQVVAHLRAPAGCPWDRAQTHRSLRNDLLEECYEVLETLDQNDVPHLREELGDLLLHIFLQAQIASEAGEFLLTDVVADITAKLVRRHPHIFADVKVNGLDEIIGNWERIKQAEQVGAPKQSNIPRALPALARAQKIVKRKKIKGSAQAVVAAAGKLARARQREQAVGEALFALAAYATAKRIDAESALRTVASKKG